MSKKEKQLYCKVGQAVSNITLMLALSSTYAFIFVYAMVH